MQAKAKVAREQKQKQNAGCISDKNTQALCLLNVFFPSLAAAADAAAHFLNTIHFTRKRDYVLLLSNLH